MQNKRLIVIGGGASGFFCAVNAARLCNNLEVIILEKSSKVLSKVKISGGGRCNVTNHCFEVPSLINNYPRGKQFLKRELFQFTPKDTIDWFESRGVPLKIEQDGRVFPKSDRSDSIIDALISEARNFHVKIDLNTKVTDIKNVDGQWILNCSSTNVVDENRTINCDFICVACGGFPKIIQFDWLNSLGHSVINPVPSLFTFNIPDKSLNSLMGVSLPKARVKILGTKLKEEGPIMITHWGLSGPVILRLSAWGAKILEELNYSFYIHVNWLNDQEESQIRESWQNIRNQYSAQKMIDKNPFNLPKRLWLYLLSKAEIPIDMYWSKLPAKNQNKLIQLMASDTYQVQGKTTYKDEFVTCGGIDLSQIDNQTLESKIHDHLFFAGEVMDIDGITGGFNFQHAWASGWIVAQSIANQIN